MDASLVFDNVWKRFRRGQRHRSLRDFLPALAGRIAAGRSALRNRVRHFYSLKGVSFQARAGECVGIIGPNGAGKSTVLKCAARILRPNRGAVRVSGRVSALIEVGAGFHPELTGRENVFLNGIILGMPRRELARRFDDIVSFAGVGSFIDLPVKRFSSGMYARLGFSVAAFVEPHVLLVDEVLSVGDMSFARQCEEKIAELRRGGTCVLFVSHNLAAIRSLCDRVLVVNGGRVVFEGEPSASVDFCCRLMHDEENAGESHFAIHRLRVLLSDEEGQPISSITAGGSGIIELAVQVRHKVHGAELGFFIQSEDGQTLYECSSIALGEPPIDLQVGAWTTAQFPFVANLLPGCYWIGSLVRGRPEREAERGGCALDYTGRRCQLIVSGKSVGQGGANLFSGCKLELPRESSDLHCVAATGEGLGRKSQETR